MDVSNLHPLPLRRAWPTILYAIAFLVILQLVRAGLNLLCRLALPPDLPFLNELSTLVTFGGLTLVWLLVLRPTKSVLGMDKAGMSRAAKIWHIAMTAVLAAMLLFAAIIDLRLLVANLASAIVVPIAEEMIFRGYLWNKLENALPGRWQQLLTWVITTVLFGLWHLGYIDAVVQHTTPQDLQQTSLAFIMFMKVLVGGAVGALAGLARWKTKRVYAAVFVHAMWNIFGR